MASFLDRAAKTLSLTESYCIMAQFMDSDTSVKNFCKRLTLGCEREMLVWRYAFVNPFKSVDDYLKFYKAGRQGKLQYESLFKLLKLTGRGSEIPRLERVLTALQDLDYSSTQPKDIPALMYSTIQSQIKTASQCI